MPFGEQEVIKPVHISEAFGRQDDAAVLSQAATLLILGGRLRGDSNVGTPSVASLQSNANTNDEDNDLAAMGIPHLRPTFGRINSGQMRKGMQALYGGSADFDVTDAIRAGQPGKVDPKVMDDMANRLARNPEDVGAARLMEASLNHPHELVRVAAAVAYFDRSSEPDRLMSILRQGTKSTEPLVRDVAATALGHIAPEDDSLRNLNSPGPAIAGSGAAATSRTTVLVAGTWAANSPWWKPSQPGNDFYTYLTGTLPSLARTAPLPAAPPWDAPYSGGDYYRWTGGYSDNARADGAQKLLQWVTAHNSTGPDLITHSHGGNVAFAATQLGVAVKEAVVLSCPVHFPKYLPDFANVQKIVSVRVHMDLVILADRGGQRFNDPRIQENVLGVWFDHFATHDPAKWTKYNAPAML